MSVFEPLADGKLRLRIRLTPNARTETIGGLQEDADGNCWLKASVRAVPENGKANKALVKLLAAELGIPKTEIGIIGGHTSRNKTLLVPATPEIIEKLTLL